MRRLAFAVVFLASRGVSTKPYVHKRKLMFGMTPDDNLQLGKVAAGPTASPPGSVVCQEFSGSNCTNAGDSGRAGCEKWYVPDGGVKYNCAWSEEAGTCSQSESACATLVNDYEGLVSALSGTSPTIVIGSDISIPHQLDITRAVTIKTRGGKRVLSAAGTHRIIRIKAGMEADVVLSDLEITGGDAVRLHCMHPRLDLCAWS